MSSTHNGLVHDLLSARGMTAAQAALARPLVDRSFTVAPLIRAGFAPGPRERAHAVRRLLPPVALSCRPPRHAGARPALAGASLDRLDGPAEGAD
ncbi:hypothetical protein ACWD5Q_27015 [Streptomyces sp. NPDC002513]